jgi:predicted Zn-dependent protease with MMP-like domain
MTAVTFDEFELRARQEWDRIPAEFRAGVDGVVVDRAAKPHPSLPDVYTLGECLTESYPSAFGDAETIRSVVVLYYGSFFRLSRIDAEFDWEVELWETLTHELQHHLESLASDDSLVDMDYAADENFRRYQGEPFDPFFFRHGLPEDGWFRVEDEFFLELAAGAAGPLTFEWRGAAYEVDPPPQPGGVTFIAVSGVAEPPAALHLVLVQPRGWRGVLRSLLGGAPPGAVESEAEARPVGGRRGGR